MQKCKRVTADESRRGGYATVAYPLEKDFFQRAREPPVPCTELQRGQGAAVGGQAGARAPARGKARGRGALGLEVVKVVKKWKKWKKVTKY